MDFPGAKVSQYTFPRVLSCVPLPWERGESGPAKWELPALGPCLLPPGKRVPPVSVFLSPGSTATSWLWVEQHLKHTTQLWDLGPGLPASCLPAGEEKVGELCRHLPQRDPEPASLPAVPSGHHQLRMLEAVVASAVLGRDCRVC